MQEFLTSCVQLVRSINPGRNASNIKRRLLKLDEEAGELSQAFLHVTSQSNPKRKTWEDIREEAVDQIVPVIDILLTKEVCNYGEWMSLSLPTISGCDDEYLVNLIQEVALPKAKLDENEILKLLRLRAAFTSSALYPNPRQKRQNASKIDPNLIAPYGFQKLRDTGVILLRRQIAFALLDFPDIQGSTLVERKALILRTLCGKLEKWKNNRHTNKQTTEDDI